MTKSVYKTLPALLVIAGSLVAPVPAWSQAWPQKPVRVFIGFPPGGTPDIVMRLISPKLSEGLGQPIIVENRTGAGGVIAMELVAKAPADGYTLALGTLGTMLLSKALFPNAAFDPLSSFEPISIFSKTSFIVVSHPNLPPRTLKEFIAFAKTQPGKLNYGSGTPGGPLHVFSEMFKSQAGLDIVGIAFRGSTDSSASFLAGNVQVLVDAYPTIGPLVVANKAIPLLVTSAERRKDMPNVPTAREAGMPDYEVASWIGIVAQAGTPAPVVRRINAEVARTMVDVEVIAAVVKIGLEPTSNTPEQFRAQIKSDWPKFSALVKASGADSK